MSYLLDTCLLSELFKTVPDRGVVEWLSDIEEERLFVSVLSLGEIRNGIAKLDDGRRRRNIQTWLDQDVRKRFDERVIAIDMEISLEWGRLCGENGKCGLPVPVIDSLLAATAICRSFTLVTRNEKDFTPYPIRVINPWNGG